MASTQTLQQGPETSMAIPLILLQPMAVGQFMGYMGPKALRPFIRTGSMTLCRARPTALFMGSTWFQATL